MRIIASFILALTLIYIPACSSDGTNATGGSSAASGGSSSSGSAGPTTPDPPGPKKPGDALKMAIFMGSCGAGNGIEVLLNDIYNRKSGDSVQSAARNITSCFADKANGCKAVEQCAGLSFEPTATSCEGSCIENTDVYQGCTDTIKFLTDCSQLGYTCSSTEKTCVKEPLAPECTLATFMASCVDGAPLACSNGHEATGPVCADYGLTCSDLQNNVKACVGAGPACTPSDVDKTSINFDEGIACEGAKLRACINGFEHVHDCSTLGDGFTCQTMATASFCGLAAECDPSKILTTECEGDNIVVCNAGRLDKVDCKTLGFTGCDADFRVCIPGVASL